MPEYTVTWTTELDAVSHQDAALQAKAILQDPESTAWVFEVLETKDAAKQPWLNSGPEIIDLAVVCNPTEEEANAQLIAAAPDMYAALRHLYEDALDRSETQDEEGNEYDDWKMCRLALAKAEEKPK